MTDFESELSMAEQNGLPYKVHWFGGDTASLLKAVREVFRMGTDTVVKAKDQEQIDKDYIDYQINTGGVWRPEVLQEVIDGARVHSGSAEEMERFRDEYIGDMDLLHAQPSHGDIIDDRIRERTMADRNNAFGDWVYTVTVPKTSTFPLITGSDVGKFKVGRRTGPGGFTVMPAGVSSLYYPPLDEKQLEGSFVEPYFRQWMRPPVQYSPLKGSNWKQHAYMLKAGIWDAVSPLLASTMGGISDRDVREAVIRTPAPRDMDNIVEAYRTNPDFRVSPRLSGEARSREAKRLRGEILRSYRADTADDYDRIIQDLVSTGRMIDAFNRKNGFDGPTPTFLFDSTVLPGEVGYKGMVSDAAGIRPYMVLDTGSVFPVDSLNEEFTGYDALLDDARYHNGLWMPRTSYVRGLPGLPMTRTREGRHILDDLAAHAMLRDDPMAQVLLGEKDPLAVYDDHLLDGVRGYSTVGDIQRALLDSEGYWLVPGAGQDGAPIRQPHTGIGANLHKVAAGEYPGGKSTALDEVLAYLTMLMQGAGMKRGLRDDDVLFPSRSGGNAPQYISAPATAQIIADSSFDRNPMRGERLMRMLMERYKDMLKP